MSEGPADKRQLAASTGEFAELVARGTPTPGGGSVAAYCGLLASALGRMMCNLTAGKAKFSAVEPRILEIKEQLEALSRKLGDLVDADADSFEGVLSAYKLPKASDEEKAARSSKIQEALMQAIIVPSQTVELSMDALGFLQELAEIGNPNAQSDVATAAQVAFAAMKSAYYNVAVNLGSLSEPVEAASLALAARQRIEQAEVIAREIEAGFLAGLG